MFTQFFFLLLTLTLISLAPTNHFYFWVNEPALAFITGLIAYAFIIGLIHIQTKILKRFRKFSAWPLNLALVELLLFLCLWQFGLGSQRFLFEYFFPSSSLFFSLLLYLAGLGWALQSVTHDIDYSQEQVLFVIPFCVPFLIFHSLMDGFSQILKHLPLLPVKYSEVFAYTFFLGMTFIFMPFLVVKCWRCQPIQNQKLLERLENICKQLHFKHAGIKIWTIMKHAFTAGIIGVIPQFRYVMFTEGLLQQLSFEEIEAILLHEIGHSRYRHLFFYPLILVGMLLSAYLFFLFALKPVIEEIKSHDFFEGTFFFTNSLLFLLYALFLGIYFRFVFGFFSRLFERQADLHIFESALAPAYMIQALDRIAILSGHIHRQPSWHHFSIQERINFLETAIKDRRIVARHHFRVKIWLGMYFGLLGIGIIISTSCS